MPKCLGKTLEGYRCSRVVKGRSKYCYQHGQKGGGRLEQLIDYIVNEMRQKKYYKHQNRAQVEALLRNQQIGTFIIRPSSQAGQYAITHVEPNRHLGHGLIKVWRGENGRWGFSIEDSCKNYLSIEDLIKEMNENFKMKGHTLKPYQTITYEALPPSPIYDVVPPRQGTFSTFGSLPSTMATLPRS